MTFASNDPEARRVLRAADGTQLAYSVFGAPAATAAHSLVLTNGLTTTTSFWKYLAPAWAQTHRVLTWDMPGHGASSPARTPATANLAEQPALLVRMMDEAGIARGVQIGWSTGCQVVLETYRRYPERCSALVLLLGSAGRVLSTAALPLPGPVVDSIVRHLPEPVFVGVARAIAQLTHAPGGQLVPRALGLIGKRTSKADAALVTEHLLRVDMKTVQTMVASAQAHSAWDVLPTIHVPVLIVAGDIDPFAPSAQVGVAMHAHCPASTLVRLPEGTHTALFDHAEPIKRAVDELLSRLPPDTPAPSELAR